MVHEPSVAVIGGGIAGVTAALNLAERGISVSLIEREASLGGNAQTVCCKAVDGVCQLCGGCLLGDQLTALERATTIDTYYRTTVERVERQDGRFVLSLQGGLASDTDLSVDAVLLATGFEHFDAIHKGPYGFGLLPAVTTGEEMERRITLEGQGAHDDLAGKAVAFVQCVGSRDEHLGHGYCSQVCCRYAIRLARLLISRVPDIQVSVFKMDIQSSGRDMLPSWRAAQDEGVRIVAALPAVIHRNPDNPLQATFIYDDPCIGEPREEVFDLVVLSTGIMPRGDAADVGDRFGLGLNRFGFFDARPDGVSTLIPGVFVAGSCQAPRSMAESLAHAETAAETCYRHLVSTQVATEVAS